jgi:cell shape-determining protein MreC
VRLLQLEQGNNFPNDYRAVNAEVTSFPSNAFTHSLEIAAGVLSGVRLNSPVVSGDGLVGIVSNVQPQTAVVTLLTDPSDLRRGPRHSDAGPHGMLHTGPAGR